MGDHVGREVVHRLADQRIECLLLAGPVLLDHGGFQREVVPSLEAPTDDAATDPVVGPAGEAIGRVKEIRKIDFLLDLTMPVLDGFGVIQRLSDLLRMTLANIGKHAEATRAAIEVTRVDGNRIVVRERPTHSERRTE